jgi:hypothetical protein
MAPDLGRYLEDDKLVGPGGEPALAPELAGLLRDRQERVSCRLIGQILQFRAGNLHPRPAPRSLTTGGPQQHRVQLRQRRFSSRAIIGKRLQPPGRVGIKPRSRGNPVPPAARRRYAGDQCGLASELGCHGGTRTFRQRLVFPDTTVETAHTPSPLEMSGGTRPGSYRPVIRQCTAAEPAVRQIPADLGVPHASSTRIPKTSFVRSVSAAGGRKTTDATEANKDRSDDGEG